MWKRISWLKLKLLYINKIWSKISSHCCIVHKIVEVKDFKTEDTWVHCCIVWSALKSRKSKLNPPEYRISHSTKYHSYGAHFGICHVFFKPREFSLFYLYICLVWLLFVLFSCHKNIYIHHNKRSRNDQVSNSGIPSKQTNWDTGIKRMFYSYCPASSGFSSGPYSM